jgi:hypothetical protein
MARTKATRRAPVVASEICSDASLILWTLIHTQNHRIFDMILSLLLVHERYLICSLVCHSWYKRVALPQCNYHMLFHVSTYNPYVSMTPSSSSSAPLSWLWQGVVPAAATITKNTSPYQYTNMFLPPTRIPIRGITNEHHWHAAHISWSTIRTLRLVMDNRLQGDHDEPQFTDVTWMFRASSSSLSPSPVVSSHVSEKKLISVAGTASNSDSKDGNGNGHTNGVTVLSSYHVHAMPQLTTLVFDGCRVTSWYHLLAIIKAAPLLTHLSVPMDHTIECQMVCDWFYSSRHYHPITNNTSKDSKDSSHGCSTVTATPTPTPTVSDVVATINGMAQQQCARCHVMTTTQQCTRSSSSCGYANRWLCRTCLIATKHHWCITPLHINTIGKGYPSHIVAYTCYVDGW